MKLWPFYYLGYLIQYLILISEILNFLKVDLWIWRSKNWKIWDFKIMNVCNSDFWNKTFETRKFYKSRFERQKLKKLIVSEFENLWTKARFARTKRFFIKKSQEAFLIWSHVHPLRKGDHEQEISKILY